MTLRPAAFLRFAALSGCGWLLDLAILLVLVRAVGLSPFLANVLSSSTAAAMVFLVSRRRIHDGVAGAAHVRLGLYIAYTLCVILLASLTMPFLVARSATLLGDAYPTLPVFAAKALVTPPQLVLNFFVSRALARHQWKQSDAHG